MITVGIAFAMLCTLLVFKAIAGALLLSEGWVGRAASQADRQGAHAALHARYMPKHTSLSACKNGVQSGGWAGR